MKDQTLVLSSICLLFFGGVLVLLNALVLVLPLFVDSFWRNLAWRICWGFTPAGLLMVVAGLSGFIILWRRMRIKQLMKRQNNQETTEELILDKELKAHPHGLNHVLIAFAVGIVALIPVGTVAVIIDYKWQVSVLEIGGIGLIVIGLALAIIPSWVFVRRTWLKNPEYFQAFYVAAPSRQHIEFLRSIFERDDMTNV